MIICLSSSNGACICFVSYSRLVGVGVSFGGLLLLLLLLAQVVALAREVLGGNGVQADFHVAKQFCDMEAIYTYEVGGRQRLGPGGGGVCCCTVQCRVL